MTLPLSLCFRLWSWLVLLPPKAAVGIACQAVPGTEGTEILPGELTLFILTQGVKAFPAMTIIPSPW